MPMPRGSHRRPEAFSVLFFTGCVARSELFYLDPNIRFPRRLTSDGDASAALLRSARALARLDGGPCRGGMH